MLYEFTEETQKFLSPTEKRRLRQIDRKIIGLDSAIKQLRQTADLHEKDISKLDYEKNTLYYKARAKLEHACPHDDVKGPYECSRDDCSGGHLACRKCGSTVYPNHGTKKGKLHGTWDEVYPSPSPSKKQSL